jgi:hypothetical protein
LKELNKLEISYSNFKQSKIGTFLNSFKKKIKNGKIEKLIDNLLNKWKMQVKKELKQNIDDNKLSNFDAQINKRDNEKYFSPNKSSSQNSDKCKQSSDLSLSKYIHEEKDDKTFKNNKSDIDNKEFKKKRKQTEEEMYMPNPLETLLRN